ncbi:delta-like protein D [Anneissia japonica]|uniref:delta-like protein D n=1 Tax=Anneissia japonica TaxID=1529436 RepID=UPI0014259ABF|nr:delta-like protein D [Anneissia japonica]
MACVRACDNHRCHGNANCLALEVPGTCSNYLCMCPPCYYGQYCETELVDICMHSKCVNGGTCVADADNCILYTCDCPPCFTGSLCQVAVADCTSSSNTNWQPNTVAFIILNCVLTTLFTNYQYMS